MQAVIALKRPEAAFRDMHADHRCNPRHFHAFEIRRHVGLADQHIAQSDLLEMIASPTRSSQPFQCEPCERI
jgi:hypothetical protein